MDDREIGSLAERIKSSGRRRRPDGRWTNPASPLQAARFELRKSGKEVVTAIRRICRGHTAGKPCRIDVSKLSDYETGNRRPGIEHIEAFCRYYQRSPEQLGLIKWRDAPATPATAPVASGPTSNGHAPPGPAPDSGAGTEQDTRTGQDGLAGQPVRAAAGEAVTDQVLLRLLSETAALTAATTRLLRASLSRHAPGQHGEQHGHGSPGSGG